MLRIPLLRIMPLVALITLAASCGPPEPLVETVPVEEEVVAAADEGHDVTMYDPGGEYAGIVKSFEGEGSFGVQTAWADQHATLLLFAASW